MFALRVGWSGPRRSGTCSTGLTGWCPARTAWVRGPFRLPVPFQVLAVDDTDPARRAWRWRASALGVHVELEHVVEPAPPGTGGSVTRLTMWGPAPVVVLYLPLAWVALYRLVR
jgi:hypothetical protein